MKTIFSIKTKVSDREFQFLFDDKDRAERLVHAIRSVLTAAGSEEVEFITEERELFETDEDIIDQIEFLKF